MTLWSRFLAQWRWREVPGGSESDKVIGAYKVVIAAYKIDDTWRGVVTIYRPPLMELVEQHMRFKMPTRDHAQRWAEEQARRMGLDRIRPQ